MTRGPNKQAEAIVARLLAQGLIRWGTSDTLVITEKGREVAAKYREQTAPIPETRVEGI